MSARLIIDGNAVYEIDEECLKKQRKKNGWRNPLENRETEGGLEGARDRTQSPVK